MNTFYKTSSILAFLILLFSCETIVDIPIPFEKPQVTVNGVLKANYPPEIELTYSKHILDNNYDYAPISNAQVTLESESGSIELEFDGEKEVYQNPDYLIQAGTGYRVIVSVPDYDPIEASDEVPATVRIKDFTLHGEVPQKDNSESSDQSVSIFFDDPAGENFYEIYAYYSNSYENESEERRNPVYLTAKNPVYENNYAAWDSILLNDKLFDGGEASIELLISSYYFDEPDIYIVLNSVSKSYYQYATTFGLQDWNEGDPFAQPVQVFSNVKNGIGILMGRSSDSYKIK